MIVACPSCASRFQYDESRFQGVLSKRFRCPKCSHVFEVQNPLLLTPVPELPTPQDLPPEPTVTAALRPPVSAVEPPVGGSTARQDRPIVTAPLGGDALPRGLRISLAVLNGPHASTVRVLTQLVTVIGREDGDIITHDPETSRRHAKLEIHYDGSVWLTDLGSTNGTFVEGTAVTGTLKLQDRQEFTCGKSTFMLLVRTEDQD